MPFLINRLQPRRIYTPPPMGAIDFLPQTYIKDYASPVVPPEFDPTYAGLYYYGKYGKMTESGTYFMMPYYTSWRSDGLQYSYIDIHTRSPAAFVTRVFCGQGTPVWFDASEDGSVMVIRMSTASGTTVIAYSGPNWTTATTIIAPRAFLGSDVSQTPSVCISADGSTIVVGEAGYSTHGAVIICTGANWATQQTVTYPDIGIHSGSSANFGILVGSSADGSKILAGCPGHGIVGSTTRGAMYVLSGASWATVNSLYPPAPFNNSNNIGKYGTISPDGSVVVGARQTVNTSSFTKFFVMWSGAGYSTGTSVRWDRNDGNENRYSCFAITTDNKYLWATSINCEAQMGGVHRIDISNPSDRSDYRYWMVPNWNTPGGLNSSVTTSNGMSRHITVSTNQSVVAWNTYVYAAVAPNRGDDPTWICTLQPRQHSIDLVPSIAANSSTPTAFNRFGQWVAMSNDGTAMVSFSPLTGTYLQLGSNFNATGRSTYPYFASTSQFNPSTNINATTDVITFGSVPTQWTTGMPVHYRRLAGASANIGLTQGTIYYVRMITTSSVAVYTTEADAVNDVNRIDLVTGAAETHYLTPATVGCIPGFKQSSNCVAMSPDGDMFFSGMPLAPRSGTLEGGGTMAMFSTSILGWNRFMGLDIATGSMTAGDRFGRAISISDDRETFVVSAVNPELVSHRGKLRIFSGANYADIRNMDPPEAAQAVGEQFGTTVLLKKNAHIMIVGAPLRDTTSSGLGKIYIYTNVTMAAANLTLSQTLEDPNGTTGYTEVGYYVDASADGSIIVFSGKSGVTNEHTIFVYHLVNGYVATITKPGVNEFGRLVKISGDGKNIFTIDHDRNVYRYSDVDWAVETIWPNTSWTPPPVATEDIGIYNQCLMTTDFYGLNVAIGDPLGGPNGGGQILILSNGEIYSPSPIMLP